MAETGTPYKVMFFLGAGASVEAGVPDTYGLVEEFRIENKDNELLSVTVDKVISVLQKWLKHQQLEPKVDVELLLETLEKLRNPTQEPLLEFYKTSDYALRGYQEKKPIVDILRDFIKRRAVVSSAGSAHYLSPFLEFIEQFGFIDIFSVNYDTAIEQLCSLHRRTLVDGFDSQWNPSSFKNPAEVRLYKLHGSVTWYRTDRGEYLKIPVRVETDTLSLINDDKASSLILYPMRKWQYTEPLLELLTKLKEFLEQSNCCIVVGYSFRDDHITRIFLDAARRNPSLHMILVGPHAEELYRNKLEFYTDTANELFPTPSSLSGRVVCLPYLFGNVFPHLRDMSFNLNNGLSFEKSATRARLLAAGSQDWMSQARNAFTGFIESEHLEKIEEILSSLIDWNAIPGTWGEKLQWSYVVWFHHSWRGHSDKSNEWSERVFDSLMPFELKNLDVWIQVPHIMLRFLVDKMQMGSRQAFETIRQISDWTDSRLRLINTRKISGKEDIFDALSKSKKSLNELTIFLNPWQMDLIQAEEYEKLRGEKTTGMNSLVTEIKALQQVGSQAVSQTSRDIVEQIEGSRLQPIIDNLKSAMAGVSLAITKS